MGRSSSLKVKLDGKDLKTIDKDRYNNNKEMEELDPEVQVVRVQHVSPSHNPNPNYASAAME